MAAFLVKTEPSDFSFDELLRAKRARWDGVTNNAALIHLRSMRNGDSVFVYHTGDEKSVVGLARADSDPYEDPASPGKNAKGEPKFAVIDLAPVKKVQSPVPLAAIKADKRFAKFPLVTQGRLSVMPVPPPLDAALRSLAGFGTQPA